MIEYFDERQQTMWGEIGALTQQERDCLRSLANQVREVGELSSQAEKIALHKAHNSLCGARPVLLAFLDQGAWNELVRPDTLIFKDPFWRSYELFLRRLLYRAAHIHDDFVIEPCLEVPLVFRRSGWGIAVAHSHTQDAGGAWGFQQSLTDWDMLSQMQDVTVAVDETLTQRNFEAVHSVLGDVISVRQSRVIPIRPCILRDLAEMRGLEQLMYDLADEPEQVHAALRFMSGSYLRLIDALEQAQLLAPNTGNHYVGSGGVGYTDALAPVPGQAVTCAHMWGFGEAQELALVSPEMYEEFAVQYLVPVLERFGLNAFACCESLDGKYESLRKIHHLRRVSISPWSSLEQAAQALQDSVILSWKPEPSQVIQGFDAAACGRCIEKALETTKQCHLEIVLKDLITVHGDIRPVQQWVELARSKIDQFAGV